MNIKIKQPYLPETTLTLETVSAQVTSGELDPNKTLYWDEKQAVWVPLSKLVLLKTEKLSSPSPSLNQNELLSREKTNQGLKSKGRFIIILERVSVSLCYIFLFCGVLAFSTQKDQDVLTFLTGVLAIVLFRRLIRQRSEILLNKHSEITIPKLYIRSYSSALLRWLIFFVVLIIFATASSYDPNESGHLLGGGIVVTLLGLIFSVDLPYSSNKSFKILLGKFPQRSGIGWLILGGILLCCFIPVISIFINAAQRTITNASANKNELTQSQDTVKKEEAARTVYGNSASYSLVLPADWTLEEDHKDSDLMCSLLPYVAIQVSFSTNNYGDNKIVADNVKSNLNNKGTEISSSSSEKVNVDGREWLQFTELIEINGKKYNVLSRMYTGSEGTYGLCATARIEPLDENVQKAIPVMDSFKFPETRNQ